MHKLLNLILFSLVIALIEESNADCPVNFLQLHNKCYYFSKDVDSWQNAHFRCSELNSTLVMLRSKHNSKRLTNYLLKDLLEPKEWWIGANYNWKRKQWSWGVIGKPVKFNHFVHEFERKKLEWSCAFLDQRHQYKWNADLCTAQKYFICMQNLDDYNDTKSDNEIPIIISRGLLEEQQIKRKQSNQPAFIAQPPKVQKKWQRKLLCPKGYGYVRDKCYKFSKDQATWQEAFFNCAAESNSTLAIIPDKKYDRGIRRYAKRIGATVFERWINGIYDWQKTSWKWASNGIVIQHQEKDKELLRWHCLIWSPLITDKWTSDSCVIRKHYICETTPHIFMVTNPLKSKKVNNDRFNRTQ